MKEIELIFERLFNYFEVNTIVELSSKLNTSQSTISKWKQRSSSTGLKKKCRELGIYEDIFNFNTTQNNDNNAGNTAFNNYGNQNQEKNKEEKDIDKDVLKILKSAMPIITDDEIKKESLIKNLKEWIIGNI